MIGGDGSNLGVMPREEAIRLAEGQDLDLIEISPGAVPPVARIMDYGKYKYQESKRRQVSRHKPSETKTVQVKIATGEYDLELKAKKASQFLREGHRVKVELFLAGRAKYLQEDFLKERLNRLLHFISEEYKVAQDIRRGPKGLVMLIEKK